MEVVVEKGRDRKKREPNRREGGSSGDPSWYSEARSGSTICAKDFQAFQKHGILG